VHDVITNPHYADDLMAYYLTPPHKVNKTKLAERFLLAPNEAARELPRNFWLVERGNETSMASILAERNYQIRDEQSFDLGNGLRIYLMRR
jgi:hypothetical protein